VFLVHGVVFTLTGGAQLAICHKSHTQQQQQQHHAIVIDVQYSQPYALQVFSSIKRMKATASLANLARSFNRTDCTRECSDP